MRDILKRAVTMIVLTVLVVTAGAQPLFASAARSGARTGLPSSSRHVSTRIGFPPG